MGRKTDALLGRHSNTRKVESFATLAIARINNLKKQHNVRCSLARSDVVQLLNLGHQDRALLRVEQVIKEQNMLDVLDMVEKDNNLLIKRLPLLKNNTSKCPEELNEAISSLIFAASRCGELPELQEIRVIFSSIYGKEYADCAIELRNDCRVNPEMVKTLSTRRPSEESRKYLLKQIASDNGIGLCLANNADENITENQRDGKHKEKQTQPHEAADLKDHEICIETRLSIAEVPTLSESIKARLSIINSKEYSI